MPPNAPPITPDRVLETLRTIQGPDRSGDVVSLGLVSDIVVNGGKVYFALSVDPARAGELEPMRRAAEQAVGAMPGVERAMVTLTAHAAAGRVPVRPQPGAVPGRRPPPAGSVGRPAPGHQIPGRQAPSKTGVPGVGAIVAVASGKGGVGKSTTAVNLALGFAANGLKTGLLDADIYGPSIPRLLAITGKPETESGRVLKPMQGHGLKVMSIGFLVEEDTPMIWRGPMVISAITQMLREVAWGELDVLVVDMPPGTGDAQLTMAQQVPLAGAVIVSTPQDLALIDARKGINMFRKVDVPILGIVENMSYFLCPHCGGRSDVFGHGGARHEAERLGVTFLGEVPLNMTIRERSDSGQPVVVSEPESAYARIYRDIAARAWETIVRNAESDAFAAPRFVIE